MQHLDTTSAGRALLWLLILGAVALLAAGCEIPDNKPYANSVPDTRLANVPNNDTIGVNINQGAIPEQTLYWAGDDPDGYVVGYRYRWVDLHRAQPETTAWRTLINLTNLAGSPLDTLMEVYPRAGSVFRIYNFFATIKSSDQDLINSIQDALSTGRWFAVPYGTGGVDGDSIRGADPVQIEAPNKGTFIFNSPSDSNQHRFEVKAIDNDNAEDPTPATVYFWTRRSPGPTVFVSSGPSILFPAFVIRCPTEAAPGLTFTFGGYDASTNEREYSWTVDDSTQNWSPWSSQPRAIVTAANLLPTPTDTHIMYVRGRNRWGVISAVAWSRFRAWIPPLDEPGFPKRILLFNNTRDQNYGTLPSGAIDSSALKSFYSEILDSLGWAGRYDWYNRHQATGFPWIPRRDLTKYTTVIILAEARITIPFGGAAWQLQPDKLDSLREYVAVGGNVIWIGSPSIKSLFGGGGYPLFATQIFHTQQENIVTPFREDPEPNFVGAYGRSGYPDVTLDPAKVLPESLGLRYISTHWPRGFGETIFEFNHRLDDPAYEHAPLGIRYQGMPADPGAYCRPTYSIVYVGFPLYYINKSQVVEVLRKALVDINAE